MGAALTDPAITDRLSPSDQESPPDPKARARPAKRRWLSPINARRWENFKATRRAYWSLWLFSVLFAISLLANVLANDVPLLVSYKDRLYVPVLVDYPEEEFGGFLATTNYQSEFIREEIEANGWMIWPPVRYSFDTFSSYPPEPAPSKPSWLYTREQRCANLPQKTEDAACVIGNWNWLGTDDATRDVLARAIYGFRISVLFGLVLTVFSSVIGIIMGAIQGYFGGWVDLTMQRLIEVFSNMPVLYIIIIISAVVVPGFWTLLIIMLLISWVGLVGVVRAEFLRARNFEYITAARALGVPNFTIMWRHVLPNAMVATITFTPFFLNGSITSLTALDYLGYGLPVGSASLGEMMGQGERNLHAPWLGLTAFFVTALLLSLLIFIGEGVRNAFDPRKTFS